MYECVYIHYERVGERRQLSEWTGEEKSTEDQEGAGMAPRRHFQIDSGQSPRPPPGSRSRPISLPTRDDDRSTDKALAPTTIRCGPHQSWIGLRW